MLAIFRRVAFQRISPSGAQLPPSNQQFSRMSTHDFTATPPRPRFPVLAACWNDVAEEFQQFPGVLLLFFQGKQYWNSPVEFCVIYCWDVCKDVVHHVYVCSPVFGFGVFHWELPILAMKWNPGKDEGRYNVFFIILILTVDGVQFPFLCDLLKKLVWEENPSM